MTMFADHPFPARSNARQDAIGTPAAIGQPATPSRALAGRCKALAGMVGVLLMLAGCETPAQPDPCPAWRPILPSDADLDVISPDLRDAILEHNLTGQRLCKWFPDLLIAPDP